MTSEPLLCGCPAALQTARRAGAYVLRRGTYLPSCRLGPHAHPEDRVILTVGARQALYRPAGLEHHDRFARETVCLAILMPDDRTAPTEPFAVVDADLNAIAGRLAVEIDATDRASELVIEGLSAQVIGRLRTDRWAPESAPRWILRVRDWIHDEYAHPPSLQALAAAVDRDPSYVATTFRCTFGRTIGDYARELRMWQARQLVEDLAVPLIDIAPRAGFSDQSHLSRWFRRYFGIAPGEYRKRARASALPRSS
jgi:AraC-like DNA-binding protein